MAGSADNSGVQLNLTPSSFPEGADVGPVRAEGVIQEDGSLSGEWRSTVGTRGTFLAFKRDPLVSGESQAAQPQVAISYTKRRGVIPCAVDSEVLRRIFRELSAGSDEAARLEIARQAQVGALTGAQPTSATAADLAQVRGAYSVMVTARGRTGEQKLALDSAILEEENLPKPLEVVEFNIGTWYQHSNNMQAPNRARVTLDFTKPPPFELSNPSLAPTPNNSGIEVVGNDSMWVSGVYEKLTSTLQQGRLRIGWLHGQYTYDVLLILIGLPGVAATATLFGRWLGARYFEGAILSQFAGFVLSFWIALYLFRFSFSLVRWLLPLVEFSPPVQPLHRQIRLAVSVVVLGLIGSLAATALWYVIVPGAE